MKFIIIEKRKKWGVFEDVRQEVVHCETQKDFDILLLRKNNNEPLNSPTSYWGTKAEAE